MPRVTRSVGIRFPVVSQCSRPSIEGFRRLRVVVSVVGVVEIGTWRFSFGTTESASFVSSRRGSFVNYSTEHRSLLLIHTVGSSGWQKEVKKFDVSKVVKRGGGTVKSGRRESLGMRREM